MISIKKNSLLIGPNGFGKTTIFDALELCLTGEIYRTSQKDHVTKHVKDYKKPFYQNDSNEDVIIKVWLENSFQQELIIVKYLNKNKNLALRGTSRKNKPKDFSLIDTFEDDPQAFDADIFEYTQKKKLSQLGIDNFFGFEEEGFKINKIYSLFNYLQQEETTFFLKQSETERKESLSFLFQTTNQEEKLNKIKDTLSNLSSIMKKLENKKDKMIVNMRGEERQYSPIFGKESFEFDDEELFVGDEIDEIEIKRDEYLETIDGILTFRKNFSPEEHIKKRNLQYLNTRLKAESFFEFCILNKFLAEDILKKLIYQDSVARDKEGHKAFLLQKFLGNGNLYEQLNNKYTRYQKYIKILQTDIFTSENEDFDNLINEVYPEAYSLYKGLISEHKIIKTSMRAIDLSINLIISYRDKIHSELHKDENISIESKECPYCGYEWESNNALDYQFIERENELHQLIGQQSQRIVEIEKEVSEKYLSPVTEHIKAYITENSMIDADIIKELKGLHNIDVSKIEEIGKNSELEQFVLKDLTGKSYKDILSLSDDLEKILTEKLVCNNSIFDKVKSLRYISYDKEMEFVKKELSDLNLKEFELNPLNEEKITDTDLIRNKELLLKAIEHHAEIFKYNNDKVIDNENYYSLYFDSNREAFYDLSIEKLEEKKKYVVYSFQKRQEFILNVYNDRKSKLSNIITNIESIRDTYKVTIGNHKREMANNIKLPFYLYTAKILQNYQQGFGVFLSTNESNDSIRFLTDPTTDHDAMHHLSSGQLAVISLAFTLAINKTYNISNDLKFLVIDDPIQDMDSLNVHSFIELMRHEFISDYQLIVSTHNDLSALYMKYKFERMHIGDINMLNVQKELYDA